MKKILKLTILLTILLILSSCGKNKNIDSYVGSYYGDETHQRVNMVVTKVSDNKLSFEIAWSNGAADEVVWTFIAESKDNIFNYKDGQKVDRHYEENGTYSSPSIYYENGSGKIIFDDSFAYWTSYATNESFDEQIKLIKN